MNFTWKPRIGEAGPGARFYCLRELLIADLNLNDFREAFEIAQFSDQECYLLIHRNKDLLYELLAALYQSGRYEPGSGIYRFQIDIKQEDLEGLKGKLNAKQPSVDGPFLPLSRL